MSKTDWIRDLVRAEQQMETADMVDFSIGFDADKTLLDETTRFLNEMKESFVDASVSFNQLKGVAVGNIKIYGIANTEADFMLFRNGFKLIFSMKSAGLIAIRFQGQGSFFPSPGMPAAAGAVSVPPSEEVLEAQWGAFGELVWMYKGLRVNIDYLVRYYLTSFVRESAK